MVEERMRAENLEIVLANLLFLCFKERPVDGLENGVK